MCTAHIMNTVKRAMNNLYPKARSKAQLALRIVGRLVHVGSINECLELIKHIKILMMSAYNGDALLASVKYVEDSINSFEYRETCSEPGDDKKMKNLKWTQLATRIRHLIHLRPCPIHNIRS